MHGVPDRLVILPGGKVGFAELKRPGRKNKKVTKTSNSIFEKAGLLYNGVKFKRRHTNIFRRFTVMGKYKKKPVVINAFELKTGENVPDWFIEAITVGMVVKQSISPLEGITIVIRTLEGEMTAKEGDYIIRGVEGEIYPCKREIFKRTYEEVME